MTKKEYIELEPFDKYFHSAVERNYIRMSSSEFQSLCDAYERVKNTKLSSSQKTCSTCRLKWIKSIGQEYIDYQTKKINKEEKEK